MSLDAACSSANYSAPKVVLIGDHAQLPATVLSKAASNEGLSTSLFERMVAWLDFIASHHRLPMEHSPRIRCTAEANQNCLEPTVLLEQRRMHCSIAEFPNSAFYGGGVPSPSCPELAAVVSGRKNTQNSDAR